MPRIIVLTIASLKKPSTNLNLNRGSLNFTVKESVHIGMKKSISQCLKKNTIRGYKLCARSIV